MQVEQSADVLHSGSSSGGAMTLQISDHHREMLASLGAGTMAGAAGVFVGHPFDTLKTRMQCNIQINKVAKDADMSSLRQLYRGVVPPLVTAGVLQSANFAMYEYFKDTALERMNTTSYSSSYRLSPDLPPGFFTAVFIGGVISGAFSTVVTAPVSLIKVRQQLATRAGVIDCARLIYRTGGLQRFYRAYPVIFVADSFGRGIYLGTYETTKHLLQKARTYFTVSNADNRDVAHLERNEVEEDGKNSLSNRMISAATAGCFSWFVTYPLDVVKSRMQFDIARER
jgi:solute carrier family 25 carnitine/acylcarnitine transporter 20/29